MHGRLASCIFPASRRTIWVGGKVVICVKGHAELEEYETLAPGIHPWCKQRPQLRGL